MFEIFCICYNNKTKGGYDMNVFMRPKPKLSVEEQAKFLAHRRMVNLTPRSRHGVKTIRIHHMPTKRISLSKDEFISKPHIRGIHLHGK